jgi:hypothetical protein
MAWLPGAPATHSKVAAHRRTPIHSDIAMHRDCCGLSAFHGAASIRSRPQQRGEPAQQPLALANSAA